MVSEICRVLKPGGALIADVVPGFDEGHLPGEYKSTFWSNVDQLVDALTAAGLRLVSRRNLARTPWQQFVMTPTSAASAASGRIGLVA